MWESTRTIFTYQLSMFGNFRSFHTNIHMISVVRSLTERINLRLTQKRNENISYVCFLKGAVSTSQLTNKAADVPPTHCDEPQSPHHTEGP